MTRFALPNGPLTGMALMVAAVLCFAGSGACYRLAIEDGAPLALLPFSRAAFTLLILSPWLLRQGPSALATRRLRWHLARGAAGIASFGLYLLAIAGMPLADAIAIMQARPLWALPLAVLLLKEKLRRNRVLAALVGFAGVVLIARPEGDAVLGLGALAAAGSGITGALVLICMKRLSGTEPPPRVIAWYAVMTLMAWAPFCWWSWRTPGMVAVVALLGASICAVIGDVLAQLAARRAEVGLLAPMEYAAIPASALFGAWLFGESPGWSLAAGTALMVAATLWLIRASRRG